MRRKDREVTRTEEILGIVGKARILHLGLHDGDYPCVVPLHYGYEFLDGSLVFYMHSAKEGHKLDMIRNDPHVFVALECDVALIPGGDVPCSYGSAYASVMGRGLAELVDDEREKIRALSLLMENQTGKRFDIDGRMASAVAVIKVVVREFTAKARKNWQDEGEADKDGNGRNRGGTV